MKYYLCVRNDSYSLKLSQELAKKLDGIINNSLNLVVSIGGDGSLLRAVHQYLEQIENLVFVSVKTGTLGFLTHYLPQDLEKLLHQLKNNDLSIKSHRLLMAQVYYPNEIQTYYAVNEFRVESIHRTLDLNINISNLFTERLLASGVAVSGQLGSTAYNRGLFGAIVDQDLEILQLSEVITVKNHLNTSLQNSIILNQSRIIEIDSVDFAKAYLLFDHLSVSLEQAKKIKITLSDRRIYFGTCRERDYLEKIQNLA